MKKGFIFLLIAAVVVVLVFALRGGSSDQPNEGAAVDSVKVAATIFPIYDIAQTVAGDNAEVVLMLPPGASPHTFDPKPSLIRDLEGAQAVFAIGHSLDAWATEIAAGQGIPVLTVDAGIDIREFTEGDHDEHKDEHHDEHDEGADHDEHEDDDHHGHDHGPTDPHYWLSLGNGARIAKAIAAELGEIDSENASAYEQRAASLVNELMATQKELEVIVAPFASMPIVSMHDAWEYFAADFGLGLVGTFEPSAGKEPTPQYLANLQHEVEELGVGVLFMEPQLSTNAIKAFADDNGLSIAIIDPLGGVEGRESYLELMRYNVEQVVAALQ